MGCFIKIYYFISAIRKPKPIKHLQVNDLLNLIQFKRTVSIFSKFSIIIVLTFIKFGARM